MTRSDLRRAVGRIAVVAGVLCMAKLAWAAWDSTKPAQTQTVSAGMDSAQQNFAAIAAGTATLATGTAAQGDVFYQASATLVSRLAAGTAGQLLRTGGAAANPAWTTPTYPNSGGTAGQWLRTDGTNYGLSTPTLPNTIGAAGTYLCSDGTNWVTCNAPVFGRVVRTAGNVTTTSTTPVDLTGATVTFTTGAFPAQVDFFAVGQHSAADSPIYFSVMVDGVSDTGTYGLEIHTTPTVNKPVNCSFAHQTAAQTAASHTVKVQWAVDAATATLLCNSQSPCIFAAHEIR